MKSLKDENRALRQELHSKTVTIEKLEKTVQKLQLNEVNEKQLQDLSSDLKRTEMKLRKMKERRNYYRSEKDAFGQKLNDMQKDNEQLHEQVNGLQEKSHTIREENSKLQAKLRYAERQLERVSSEVKNFEEQAQALKS